MKRPPETTQPPEPAARLATASEDKVVAQRFCTKPFDAGICLVGNIDNVAEALAIAEGEDFR